NARAPRRRLELRAVVFVAAAPPRASARLVASLRRPVEPLIHPPQAVEAARVGGVRVVDDAVLERERAHARRFAEERVEIDAHALREAPGMSAFALEDGV